MQNKTTYHDQVGFIPEMQSWFNIWNSNSVIHHIYQIEKKNKPWRKDISQRWTFTRDKNSAV